MEHNPEEFRKLLRQVMSQECKPLMSEEEIHFEAPEGYVDNQDDTDINKPEI